MPPLTCSVAARECSDLLGERWEVDQKELGLWWDGEQAGRAGWAVVRDGHGGADGRAAELRQLLLFENTLARIFPGTFVIVWLGTKGLSVKYQGLIG